MMNGIQKNAAFWYHTVTSGLPATFICCEPPRNPRNPRPISHGVSSCTSETPKLPMPAWTPSAVPAMRLGKKYDVDGMKPEKAPPPMPARNASTISSQ